MLHNELVVVNIYTFISTLPEVQIIAKLLKLKKPSV